MRESLRYADWPVELFVHTERSLAHYCGKDHDRRQPSMMRLVGESIILLDTTEVGDLAMKLQADCMAQVEAGPEALSEDELAMLRYRVTDLLEDLVGANSNDMRAVVAASLWQEAAALLLTGDRRWSAPVRAYSARLSPMTATAARPTPSPLRTDSVQPCPATRRR
jgi:hypothetical protein